MILSEKIIKLRKQLGWSQEELAEKMQVSRQSVSKWESTSSIPDLKKIMKLAELFNVTTDFLLKDEADTVEYLADNPIQNARQVNLEQALIYIECKTVKARSTAIAVAIFVCSSVPLFFLLALTNNQYTQLDSKIAIALGFVGMFVMIAAGIRQIITNTHSDRQMSEFEKTPFELAYGVHSACTEKLDAFMPRFNNRLSLSILLFITSSLPLILVAIFFTRADLVLLMLVALIGLLTIGLWILIPSSAKYEAFKFILNEGDQQRELSQSEYHAKKLAPFYFPFIIAIYLGWSLWTMNWGVTWIILPVAAVLFAALIGLMGLIAKEPSES